MTTNIQPGEKITRNITLAPSEWDALLEATGESLSGSGASDDPNYSNALGRLLNRLSGSQAAGLSKPSNLAVSKGETITAYTDGACSRNPGPGGWAVVLVIEHLDGSEERVEFAGDAPETTNNRMELQAAIEALSALPQGTAVKVVTDSKYVRDGAVRWMPRWKENGWKNAERKPVKNKDLFTQLDELLQTRDVSWKWIKGHVGEELNERADELARGAIQSANNIPN